MKKSHIALAIAALVPAFAQAQSNVTMYGVAEPTVDIGYKSTTVSTVTVGGVTTIAGSTSYKPGFRLQDGNSQGQGTSRVGFRGNEDLGGGLKANFQFEMGIRIDDGCVTTGAGNVCSSGNSGGNLFGRNAWAGLSGGFGEIRLGRQVLGSFGVQANSWAAGSSNGLYEVGANTAPLMGGVRFSNAIKYITPNLGGLTASLSLAAPETAGQAATSSANAAGVVTTSTGVKTGIDLTVEYGAGPVYVGFGYNKTGGSGLAATVATANDTKAFTFGGSFNLGVAQPFVNYTRQTSSTATTVALGSTSQIHKAFAVGVRAPVGALTLIASYGKGDIDATLSAAGTTVISQAGQLKAYQIGAQYSLSKRTTLEANYGQFRRDNAGGVFTPGTTTLVRVDGIAARESGLNFGVRHAF